MVVEETKRDNVVCPESTFESAIQRNSRKKAEDVELACGSTLESSIRRSFVRGALATAAVGVGAIALGRTGVGEKVIRDSSASGPNVIRNSPASCKPNFEKYCFCGVAIEGDTCYGTGVKGVSSYKGGALRWSRSRGHSA